MSDLATLSPADAVAALVERRLARSERVAQIARDDKAIAELELIVSLDAEAAVLPQRPTTTPRRHHRAFSPPVSDAVALVNIGRLLRHDYGAVLAAVDARLEQHASP